MKLILAVVAILGFANALPVERALINDIYDFVDLVPLDEIRAITLKYYLAGDLKEVIDYFSGEEFAAIVAAVRATPESQDVAAYLTEAGIDYAKIYAYVKERLENASSKNSQISSKSLSEYWAEIKAVLPVAEFRALWVSKLETSTDFQEFVAKLSSDTFKAVVKAAWVTPEFEVLLQKARDVGLDVDTWIEKIGAYLGW